MWELEYHHVDKAEGEHRFGFIERTVINRDNEPARAKAVIRLGMGLDGESCGHCQQPVKRDIALGADGIVTHVTDGEITPKKFIADQLAALNAFHAKMNAYVARHKVELYRGPK